MIEYEITEAPIGDDLFYCVMSNSKPAALFKDMWEARIYIALQLKRAKGAGPDEAAIGLKKNIINIMRTLPFLAQKKP